MFANASGMIAVALATAWLLYVLFFGRDRSWSTITLSQDAEGFFQEGDSITINDVQYEVVNVQSTQLKVRKNR